MRSSTFVSLLATVLLPALVGAQDLTEFPNANDLALGADPNELIVGIPMDARAKRSTKRDHRLQKRHYGVWECSAYRNQQCYNGYANQPGVGSLIGCTGSTCWVGCEEGWTTSGRSSPYCVCDSGYTLTADGKDCVNLTNDVNNCGRLGNTCTTSGTGVASGTCTNSACQLTCASGYTRSADGKSCTAAALTCKDGSYAKDGVCARYSCSTNADCQRQTGLSNSGCYQNVCFTTSSNTGGLPAGSNCGYGGLSPNGDDNSCVAGTVCVNYKCTNPFTSDNNNCGTAGNVCTTSGTGVSSGSCVSGSCQLTCAAGYTPSADNKSCVATISDINNCGTIGNKCTTSGTGVQSGSCVSGSCRLTCTSGFTPSADNKSCVATSNDVNNCGTLGNKCTTSGTGVSSGSCVGGSCQLTCASGYSPAADNKSCVPTGSDINNCGSIGNKCTTSGTGVASGSCVSGSCRLTCQSGFSPAADNKSCVPTSNDVNNCGSIGNKCTTSGTGVQSGTCVAGSCQLTCASGFAPAADNKSCIATSNDVNNCGTIGNKCTTSGPGVASGSCVGGSCQLTCTTGNTPSADGKSCIATASDVNNCGTIGNKCTTSGTGVSSGSCISGSCRLTCNSGFTPSADNKSCVATSTDVNNCGSVGNKCTTSGTGVTSGSCVAGSCKIVCAAGYLPSADNLSCSAQCKDGTYFSAGKCVRYACATNADCAVKTGVASATCQYSTCYTGSSNPLGRPLGSSCGVGAEGVGSGDDNLCATGLVCLDYTCQNRFTNDDQNCGTFGNACTTSGTGVSSGSCVNGACQLTCASGYSPSADKKSCVPTSSDVNNCGTVGNKCTTSGTGVASGSCVSGSCRLTCQTGFTPSADRKSCVATGSDVNNCGTIGNQCTTSGTGVVSGTCTNSACQITCAPGYTAAVDNKSCVATANDVNNCGTVGNKCTTSGTGVTSGTCAAGKCQLTCATGYTPSADNKSCVATSNDINNCGTIGNKCTTSGTGVRSGTCTAGTCQLTCNSGYVPSLDGKSCVATSSDVNNCGSLGNECTTSGTGVLSGSCSFGSCRISCAAGYTASADNLSCNSICKDGAVYSFGQCTRYSCSSNADCQAKTGLPNSGCYSGSCFTTSSNDYGLPAGSICGIGITPYGDDNTCDKGLVCVNYQCYNPFATDNNNCGAIGNVCTTSGTGVSSGSCRNGVCQLTCASGYTPSADNKRCVLTSSDVNNCGSIGNKCTTSGTGVLSGTCRSGSCQITCAAGYTPSTDQKSCTLTPSAKARTKKRSQESFALCPTGETACPIAGSASFNAFTGSLHKSLDFASTAGGFECMDTSTAVESCGGCASTGEGQDCTKIKHSAGVGCSAGQCVVLSCEPGFVASLNNSRCLKLHKEQTKRSRHASKRSSSRFEH